MNHRVIARLDIKGPNLVKGIHLEGLRVLGKPEEFAKNYYSQGIDELIYQDVVASLYERNSLHDIIERTASEISIPLTVGGGLRTIDDMKKVLRAGADKVCLNTAAIRNPKLISDAARTFGSSTIVIAIEAIKQPGGSYLAYVDNGREHTGVEVFSWAKQVEELGAGEIIITSVDREGTGEGYDIELTNKVATSASIPVIACGGAGQLPHIEEVFTKGKADAIALASMFHYEAINGIQIESENYSSEGNIEFRSKRTNFSKIEPQSIHNVKKTMSNKNIMCRRIS